MAPATGTLDHIYAEAGNYTVGVAAMYQDKSGGFSAPHEDTSYATLAVAESTPSVSVVGDAAAVTGETYSVNASFLDPAGDMPSQWSDSWGDGTSSQYTADDSQFTHVYSQAGLPDHVIATATTEDGTYAASLSVSVGQPVLQVIQGDGTPMDQTAQQTTGAFVSVNNDDENDVSDSNGNPIPDYQQTGATDPNDSDLVPVVLNSLPASVGGLYTLSWNTSDFQVWSDANKTTAIVNGQTQFSATAKTTLYVEGLAISEKMATDALALNWMIGVGGQLAANVAGAKATVIAIVGPQDVPAYSIYKYGVVGAVPKPVHNDPWSVTQGGTVHTEGESGDFCTVEWNSAPAGTAPGAGWFGDVAFNAPGFKGRPRRVNVVSIGLSNGIFAPGTPRDGGQVNCNGTQIKEVDYGTNAVPGLTWSATVSATGPSAGNNTNLGIDRIKIGFMQNVTGFTDTGTYLNGAVRHSSLEQLIGSGPNNHPRHDVQFQQTGPWYDSNAVFQPSAKAPSGPIRSSDKPFGGPPLVNATQLVTCPCFIASNWTCARPRATLGSRPRWTCLRGSSPQIGPSMAPGRLMCSKDGLQMAPRTARRTDGPPSRTDRRPSLPGPCSMTSLVHRSSASPMSIA